jgi:C1A family cysteine protease
MLFKNIFKRFVWLVFTLLLIENYLPALYNTAAIGTSSEIRLGAHNPEFDDFLSSVNSSSSRIQNHENIKNGLIPVPYLIKKSSNESSINAVEDLPISYDLRSQNFLTSVKNQGQIGACWTFSTNGALESYFKKFKGLDYDFSENNLLTHSGFDFAPDDGGNIYMSLAYLSRWEGPVLEADDPYPTVPVPENVVKRDGISPSNHVQDAILIPVKNSALDNYDIKYCIENYGLAYTSMNWASTYYNSMNHTYYSNVSMSTGGHAVGIVGWDDNYPKEKFSITPPGNGAFICKNTWGSNWGENGYFYVSYYDINAGYEVNAVFTKVEDLNNYSKLYQHDELGFVATLGYGANEVWSMNVFNNKTVQGTNKENIMAASFYTTLKNEQYEIYIIPNYDPSALPNVGVLNNMVKTGMIDYPGYHTIKLNEPIKLENATKFAIAIRLKSSEPVVAPVEQNVSNYTSKAVSLAGESYLSINGRSWIDIGSVESSYHSNACIKAFTTMDSNLPIIYGDFDGNGTVTNEDYLPVKNYVLANINKSIITTDPLGLRIDLDGDHIITSADCALLKRYLLKRITKFPVEN